MTLENAKQFPCMIFVPPVLQGKVEILTNTELTKKEVALFNDALRAMGAYIADKKINLMDLFTLNIFFTYNGTMSFVENSAGNCGSQFYLALYRMEKLRQLNSDVLMLFVYIEELAHYLLRISNETFVKYKVSEIMRYIVPDFQMEDVKGYGLNGL